MRFSYRAPEAPADKKGGAATGAGAAGAKGGKV
jgi:hypothetical protein